MGASRSERPPTAPRRGRLAGLVRACHPEPTVTVTVVATLLAVATGRSAAGVVAVGAAVLAGQLSVGWHNDWFDAPRDVAARRADKPIPAGRVSRRSVGTAAALALAVCIPLSLLSGPEAGAAHLLAVASAWAYNARLKATRWSWLPYAVSFALLVSFVSLGRPGAPLPPWWALGAAALLGVGAHLANTVPDLDSDRAAGVSGLPHRLGARRSVAASCALLLGASGLVAFGPGRPGWSALGLAAAVLLVAGGVLAARRGSPELLFRASLLVALVDVAMLVSQGRSL